MTQFKRTRLFIDPPVQGRLLCRVVIYWLTGVAVIGALAGLQVWLESSGAPMNVVLNRALLAFGPALIAALILLPLVLFDALRFSNKFAGPIFRLRNAVRRLADGTSYEPIHFRKGDYWFDLAEEFNRLADRLEHLEGVVAKAGLKSSERAEAQPIAN
jgi:hypothetical protein